MVTRAQNVLSLTQHTSLAKRLGSLGRGGQAQGLSGCCSIAALALGIPPTPGRSLCSQHQSEGGGGLGLTQQCAFSCPLPFSPLFASAKHHCKEKALPGK